jgi:predicted RNA-binding protein YlqC (UPF0109 family)
MSETNDQPWWIKMTDDEYLTSLVQPLCDYPISTDRKVDEMGVLLSLRVDLRDMGKVVGREGATAKCIRHLLRNFGAPRNARINLRIEEPEGSTHVRQKSSQDEL